MVLRFQKFSGGAARALVVVWVFVFNRLMHQMIGRSLRTVCARTHAGPRTVIGIGRSPMHRQTSMQRAPSVTAVADRAGVFHDLASTSNGKSNTGSPAQNPGLAS